MKFYTVSELQTDLGGGYIRPVSEVESGRSIGCVNSCAGPALIGELTAEEFLAEFGYHWLGARRLIPELPDTQRAAAWKRLP